MQQADMSRTFISTWNYWTKAIIDHALATQYTPAALKEAMRDIPKEATGAVDDIHGKRTTYNTFEINYTSDVIVMQNWSH